MPSGGLLAVLPSPHGPIHVAATEVGICALAMRTTAERFTAELATTLRAPIEHRNAGAADDPRAAHLERLRDTLDAYWAGRVVDLGEVPIDLRLGSAWDQRILQAVRTIPYGSTTSYGDVATRAGSPRAARAAGGAIGRNPIGLLIPCHRVIAADGSLGGYGGSWFGTAEDMRVLKRALLAGEGVRIASVG